MRQIGTLLVVFILSLVATAPVRADDFYSGKTVRVIVGGSAGGGFDIYTRAMARTWASIFPATRRWWWKT